jgi:hypothetical protein
MDARDGEVLVQAGGRNELFDGKFVFTKGCVNQAHVREDLGRVRDALETS